MPLQGEYEPSPAVWVRKQVKTYEGSGGTKGTTLRGLPVVVLTSLGTKSGKLVELQDGPVKKDMVAHEVTGEKKAIWWKRAVDAYPDYADHQLKTEREIPVFVLEPAS